MSQCKYRQADYDGDGNTTESINMGCYITGNEIIGPISADKLEPQISNKSVTTNNVSFDVTDPDGVRQSYIKVLVNGNEVTS